MNFKKTIALAAAVTCAFSSTAFAATKKTQEVKEIPVYTYEQVLEKVKKNSTNLTLLEQNLELMDKQSENLAQGLGGLLYPEKDGYVTLENYSALSKLNNLTVNKQSSKYQKEAIEKATEYSVMNAMTNIESSKEAIEISKDLIPINKQKYNMANLQYKLGMISETKLIEEKAKFDAYEASVESLKISCENAYKSLGRLMGMSSNDFDITYSVEYTPFELTGTIAEFAAKKNTTNPTLIGMRLNVENLNNNKAIMVTNDTTPYAYDTVMYNIANAEANLKNTEDRYKSLIENNYNQLLNMKNEIESNKSNLELAKKSLNSTSVNFSEGRATQLDLDSAKVNVKQLEAKIKSLEMTYMNVVYSLENPCVM